ncbi:AraC family transcriptional regulator [Companilactobacillus sp. HBUAS59544]|uniref:AraC family transcriptional regulator n=1 Tax=Companilactobacillus sp. HBUAS59544 TaxID=3109363 RepID=UPI002FF00B70
MVKSIMEILRSNNSPKEFSNVLEKVEKNETSIAPTKTINGKPVYRFFNTYNDNLELNTNPISISVQPIESDVPYHYHNFVDIVAPLVGNCTALINDKEIKMQQGDLLFVGNHTIHTVEPIGTSDIVIDIALRNTAFSLNELNSLLHDNRQTNISGMLFSLLSDRNYGEGQYSFFKTNNNSKISRNVWDIIDEYYHPDKESDKITRLEIMVLFSRLIRETAKTNNVDWKLNDKKRANILSLLLYIENNYSNITLDEMAKHFGYNSNYLSSFLKKSTGMTFIKLVHLQRVNAAAEYLNYTSAPIEKISYKVGYENPSYFYKIFKKVLGISPDLYRQKAQSNNN